MTKVRQLLVSISAMSAASAIGMASNLAKMKVATLAIGPTGIGLLGSLQNVIAIWVTLLSLGLTVSGARQLAEAEASEGEEGMRRMTLLIAQVGTLLSMAGALLAWLFVPLLARDFTDHAELGPVRLYASIAIALTILSCVPNAVLLGHRRVKRYAVMLSLSAISAALGGAYLIWSLGVAGIGPFLILPPAAALIVSLIQARGLIPWGEMLAEAPSGRQRLTSLVKLGFAMTLATIGAQVSQLLVRHFLVDHANLAEVGLMQSVWAISAAGTGLLVSTMWAELMPRLAGNLLSPTLLRAAINEQTRLALALCAPGFIAVICLAPLVLHVLYSRDFVSAGPALSYQLAGDLLRIAATPITCLLFAHGLGRSFVLVELLGAAIYAGSAYALIDMFGISGAALANLAYCTSHLVLMYALLMRKGGGWDGETKGLLFINGGATLIAAAATSVPSGWMVQLGALLVTSALSLARLHRLFKPNRTTSAA